MNDAARTTNRTFNLKTGKRSWMVRVISRGIGCVIVESVRKDGKRGKRYHIDTATRTMWAVGRTGPGGNYSWSVTEFAGMSKMADRREALAA